MLKKSSLSFSKNASKPLTGAFSTNQFMSVPDFQNDDEIIQKQIQVLEEAIKEYNRLEDIKKFTKLALVDIDNVTEEDIQRAVELEEKISIDDDIQVKKLLQSQGLIDDIFEI